MAGELTYTPRERKFVTWSAILGYAFDFYNLIVVAFLLVPIQKSLNVTLAQTGLIVGLTLASSVLGGVLFGWLGDKIGRKNALLWTLLLLAIGSMLSAVAWDFASLLTFRIITGIGVGGEWGAGMVLLNEVWDNRKRGLGSAIVQAMSSAGTAMAAIAATVTLTYFDQDTAWRVALGVGGLPLLLMLFVRSKMPESRLWQEFKRLKDAGELPPEKLAQSTPLIEIFKGVSVRYVIVGVIITGGYIIAYQCISIFMPTLILRDLGGNLPALRAITLWFAAISAVGMIGAGYLSDAFGRRRAIICCTSGRRGRIDRDPFRQRHQVSRRLHELGPVLGLSAVGLRPGLDRPVRAVVRRALSGRDALDRDLDDLQPRPSGRQHGALYRAGAGGLARLAPRRHDARHRRRRDQPAADILPAGNRGPHLRGGRGQGEGRDDGLRPATPHGGPRREGFRVTDPMV